ncbi:hypothetical protein [Dankookia sp. P2]|uniref:hypothetical protein n=1 Tax=Dankookia sp. P2 TaxID=3423955 RepID=UPI003D670E11
MAELMNALAERGMLPLGAFLLALLLLANELGYRIGRWRAANRLEAMESNIGMLTTGMLGLLAFTLGLTISIAESRYEARRDLVVTEANAIGTAWLRAGLVRGPEGAELRQGLEEYTRIRLDYTRAGPDLEAEAALNAATNAIQTRIWALAQTATLRDPTPVMTSLVTALNETFDSALSQRFAYREPGAGAYPVAAAGRRGALGRRHRRAARPRPAAAPGAERAADDDVDRRHAADRRLEPAAPRQHPGRSGAAGLDPAGLRQRHARGAAEAIGRGSGRSGIPGHGAIRRRARIPDPWHASRPAPARWTPQSSG